VPLAGLAVVSVTSAVPDVEVVEVGFGMVGDREDFPAVDLGCPDVDVLEVAVTGTTGLVCGRPK